MFDWFRSFYSRHGQWYQSFLQYPMVFLLVDCTLMVNAYAKLDYGNLSFSLGGISNWWSKLARWLTESHILSASIWNPISVDGFGLRTNYVMGFNGTWVVIIFIMQFFHLYAFFMEKIRHLASPLYACYHLDHGCKTSSRVFILRVLLPRHSKRNHMGLSMTQKMAVGWTLIWVHGPDIIHMVLVFYLVGLFYMSRRLRNSENFLNGAFWSSYQWFYLHGHSQSLHFISLHMG